MAGYAEDIYWERRLLVRANSNKVLPLAKKAGGAKL